MEGISTKSDDILKKLKTCNKVAMTLHKAPDGDSLGASTAMKYFLERELKCKVDLVSGDNLSEELASLSLTKEVNFGKDLTDLDLEKYDVVICIDIAREHMLSSRHPDFEFPENVFVINIDHHDTNAYYGNMNYVDSDSPSSCSVLTDLFQKWQVEFDKELATRLLLGICTDTKFFQIENHILHAFEHAVFLIKQGADYFDSIVHPILYMIPLRIRKFEQLVMKNFKMDEEKKFGWSTIRFDEWNALKLDIEDLRLSTHVIETVKDVDFVCTLIEIEENKVKGSFRGNKGVNVVRYAEELGGGGHKFAAAFVLEDTTMPDAEAMVLEVIEKLGVKRE